MSRYITYVHEDNAGGIHLYAVDVHPDRQDYRADFGPHETWEASQEYAAMLTGADPVALNWDELGESDPWDGHEIARTSLRAVYPLGIDPDECTGNGAFEFAEALGVMTECPECGERFATAELIDGKRCPCCGCDCR